MPAETHQHGRPPTLTEITELVVALLGVTRHDVDQRLDALCIADLEIICLWEAVADEHGERSLGDLDFDLAHEAETVADLIDAFSSAFDET